MKPASPLCRRLTRAGAAILAAVLLLPASAAAQACIGNPATTGQVALGALVSNSDGFTGYGVEARSNREGPLSLEASASILDMDGANDRVLQTSAGIAWIVTPFGVNACPSFGLEYTRYPDGFFDGGASALNAPIGLAIGTRAGSGSLRYLPSVEGGLLWQRFSTTGAASRATLIHTDLYIRGGATAYTGRLYGRAELERVFREDASNLFRLSVGAHF